MKIEPGNKNLKTREGGIPLPSQTDQFNRPVMFDNKMKFKVGGSGMPPSRVVRIIKSYNRRRSAAFTLIEIMVVVVILGILAATILPQFIGTAHEARVSKAKSDIANYQGAIERFYVHMDRHPTNEEGLDVLLNPPSDGEEKWRGPYLTKIRPDPWGNPYEYRIPGTHGSITYEIWSRGADGSDGGEDEAADIGSWQ